MGARLKSSLPPKSVSLLLAQWKAGDNDALRSILPLVYDELRRLAHHYMRGERTDHTLQSTALVHETYMRLEKQGAAQLKNRAHFVAVCAQLMRQILVEYARAHRAAKRDGGYKLSLDENLGFKRPSFDLVALDDALTELARLDPQQSRIVELRFFGGLSVAETSTALGLSPATVKRHWASARIWLHHQIGKTSDA
ncbi:MAG TPA: sigma-70 family RNA polymerase sigma factor [Terriglobales bacterium]